MANFSAKPNALGAPLKSNKLADYTVLGTAGEGAHGIVIKAQHNVTGQFVAFKKITLKKITEEGIPVTMIREIKALQYLDKHENIVYMMDVFPQGLSFILVFEYLVSNLWEIMSSQRLKGSQVKCYLKMILNGLEFLHLNNIMHRDLKPANLLIADNGVLKIGDFGLCRLFFKGEKRAYSHQVATRWYRAPELLYGARFYNENVDMWAVGCIFSEMLTGDPLFAGENDIDQLYKVISSLGSPNERIWPGVTELPDYKKISFLPMKPVPLDALVKTDVPKAVEFLSKFLLYDSAKRISAKKALSDPFFDIEPRICTVQELPSIPTSSKPKFADFDSDLETPRASGS